MQVTSLTLSLNSSRPKKVVNEAFKPAFSLLSPKTRDSVELSLFEAYNILMKYIRQGLYSIIRVLYAKDASKSDLWSLFTFLESSAHPDVVGSFKLCSLKYYMLFQASD